MKARGMKLVVVIAVAGTALQGPGSAAPSDADWKGAETFTQTTLVPNPTRCGATPPNVEATFIGNGVDTTGGAFLVTVTACLNTETLRVSDLDATDTYVHTQGSVFIAPDDFSLVVDPETCVAANDAPVQFRVVGGTGKYENARGSGQFDFAANWTPCNGLTQPTHVWFRGTIDF